MPEQRRVARQHALVEDHYSISLGPGMRVALYVGVAADGLGLRDGDDAQTLCQVTRRPVANQHNLGPYAQVFTTAATAATTVANHQVP